MEDPWITLSYTRREKQKFHETQWLTLAMKYPMLFDEQDRRKAIRQATRSIVRISGLSST